MRCVLCVYVVLVGVCRFTPMERKCRICKCKAAQNAHYCNQCAYKKGAQSKVSSQFVVVVVSNECLLLDLQMHRDLHDVRTQSAGHEGVQHVVVSSVPVFIHEPQLTLRSQIYGDPPSVNASSFPSRDDSLTRSKGCGDIMRRTNGRCLDGYVVSRRCIREAEYIKVDFNRVKCFSLTIEQRSSVVLAADSSWQRVKSWSTCLYCGHHEANQNIPWMLALFRRACAKRC